MLFDALISISALYNLIIRVFASGKIYIILYNDVKCSKNNIILSM